MELKELSEDLLEIGYQVRIGANGFSMFPFISTGDRITISPEKDIHTGDVVAFSRGGQLVGHKVVRVFDRDGTRYYQTAGNSSLRLDQPITVTEVLGKVTGIERGKLSVSRRVLLFIHPALRLGRLNAIVVSGLAKIKACFQNVNVGSLPGDLRLDESAKRAQEIAPALKGPSPKPFRMGPRTSGK